jgi:hypothetical protein
VKTTVDVEVAEIMQKKDQKREKAKLTVDDSSDEEFLEQRLNHCLCHTLTCWRGQSHDMCLCPSSEAGNTSGGHNEASLGRTGDYRNLNAST